MRLTLPFIEARASGSGAPTFSALGALVGVLAMANPAAATTTTGTMPWDTILTTVETDLTGPVATAIGVICCIVFGLSMAFGHEGSVMKRGMAILFGLAIAFTSSTGLLTVFGGGTGAVF